MKKHSSCKNTGYDNNGIGSNISGHASDDISMVTELISYIEERFKSSNDDNDWRLPGGSWARSDA